MVNFLPLPTSFVSTLYSPSRRASLEEDSFKYDECEAMVELRVIVERDEVDLGRETSDNERHICSMLK